MKNLLNILQIIFYVVISICTIYNLWFTRVQSNLIFKPIIGVVDIKTTRLLGDIDGKDVYENVKAVKIDFIIKNTGNLPAKNFKIKNIGKIGNTILSYEKAKEDKGVTLIPPNVLINTATIDDNVIRRLVENKEKLIFKVELFYSDWDDYKKYNYSSYFEVLVITKNPLNLGVGMLPEVEF
jgi:hypothetical protein